MQLTPVVEQSTGFHVNRHNNCSHLRVQRKLQITNKLSLADASPWITSLAFRDSRSKEGYADFIHIAFYLSPAKNMDSSNKTWHLSLQIASLLFLSVKKAWVASIRINSPWRMSLEVNAYDAKRNAYLIFKCCSKYCTFSVHFLQSAFSHLCKSSGCERRNSMVFTQLLQVHDGPSCLTHSYSAFLGKPLSWTKIFLTS